MTLSELLGIYTPGHDSGCCYVCGQMTCLGHRRAPSDSFTAWAQCYAGDVICGWCFGMLRDGSLRRSSWLATAAGRVTQTKETRLALWETLQNLPDPPFAWYVTRGRQKHGYLTLVNYVTMNKDFLWVGTDFTDRPARLRQAQIAHDVPLIERMRERKVSCDILIAGIYTTSQWSRALTEGWAEDIEQCRARAGDLAWEITVLLAP